ncbi:MAG: HesA/MoeB/ThiF family protein [Muribaculaceae bacterium]|nr:HesA/MoeB/ThiF family protein [Muribaculaceae bacterium]
MLLNNNDRYIRQIRLKEIGEEGQKKLCNSSVLIVGLGGLGSPVAMYLAGAGIGRIGLCDGDTVSEHNLHRQVLYDTASVGKLKSQCAMERLKALSPDTVFDLYSEELTDENAVEIIREYNLVVDCCDNLWTRYTIEDTCALMGKAWVHGAIEKFEGRLALFNGSRNKRFSDIYPLRAWNCNPPTCIPAPGVLGPVAGVVGSLQAAEAIKYLAGIDSPVDGKMMIIDLLTLNTDLIEIE